MSDNSLEAGAKWRTRLRLVEFLLPHLKGGEAERDGTSFEAGAPTVPSHSAMLRFFFDIRDEKGTQRDEEGVELADISMVREKAKRLLPDIARSDIPGNSDQRVYTVLVTDADGHAVYSASLTCAGLWLLR